MVGTAAKNISLKKREYFIKALPCFSMLTQVESEELAALMDEENYVAGQNIVVENELVTKVFIIVLGSAEVSHQVVVKKSLKKKTINQPLAMIGPGDSIGLNDTGFFSDTGSRTATVIATTDVTALSLDLKKLHQFLQKHTHLQLAMYSAATQMLRIRLIKQALPFVRLSQQRTQWLANQVKEVTVADGETIVKQGEMGDCCYLIRSGQVEIVRVEEDGSERKLATLKPVTLFGEAALITHEPRNATARAKGPCELLVLQHKHLSELIETEKNVATMFMTLMVDRSRPTQNPRVLSYNRTTADGQEFVILKNPDNGKYFKLSQEGWFVWQQLNGKQTMPTITMALVNKFNIFSPDIVVALISKLARDNFIERIDVTHEKTHSDQSRVGHFFSKIRQLLEFRYAFGDADKWVTKVYNKSVHILFSRLAKIVLATIAIGGLFAFVFTTADTVYTFELMPHVWFLLIPFIPATLLSVALHELGHAFATKAYGREVHYMGIGWFWLGPVAFTDTSDMWLSPQGPRIAVNLAGVYTDILVAGMSALLILLMTNPYIQAFFWIFALYTYVRAFRMLSPLQELDGYYVLMDLVDKPHLRQIAVIWLIKDFPKALKNWKLFRKNKPAVIYWLACIVFLILISTMTLLMQTFIFKVLGLHPSNPLITLSLPVLVTGVSILGLVSDMRNHPE